MTFCAYPDCPLPVTGTYTTSDGREVAHCDRHRPDAPWIPPLLGAGYPKE